MSKYNTIANISESPLDENLLYAGTDDGLIHVSTDGGENWRRAGKLSGVRDFFYVNDIKADLHDRDTVYVAVDNHKQGDYKPYLFKSTNRGGSWRKITNGIPDRHLVWRVVQDHVKPGLMFAGTEFGVFFTVDGGGNWTKLGGNAPNIPFRDLVIQKRENDLVGATFGRSFFVLDDYTPLRDISVGMLKNDVALFPVRTTRWYMPRLPLGCMMPNCPESQGNAYFVAPNPPFGAVFTYYLNEPVRSKKDQRLELEKPLNEAGKDVEFPGWAAVNEESWEDEPSMLLTITDTQGNTINRVAGPVTAGFHRVAWNLRYPTPDPWQAEPDPEPWQPPGGTLVAPGSYTVTLSQRIDGKLRTLGQSQTFEVVSIREPTIAGISQEERVTYLRGVDEIQRDVTASISAIDELIGDTAAMKNALMRSVADPALYSETHRIEKRAKQLRDHLTANQQRDFMSDPGPMPILNRIYVAGWGDRTSAQGPTQTQRRSLQIAKEEFSLVGSELKQLLEVELRQLRENLDAAGVPWTPGRGGPD